MKIINSTVNNQSPSFGVNLKFANDLPAFVQKEAMNTAMRRGKNIEQAKNRRMFFLENDLVQVTKDAKKVEPYDLDMEVSLTDSAKEYAKDLRLSGEGFKDTPTQITTFHKDSEIGVSAEVPGTPASFYYFRESLPQMILKLANNFKSKM